ncbi:GvpL/GvpF family gas vesicle protein [Streptomyces thermocarboxydus]
MRRERTRSREEQWQRAETFATGLHRTLTGFAEDSRLRAAEPDPVRPQRPQRAQRRLPRAARRVGGVRGAGGAHEGRLPGLRVELTGPWAAYSFAGESRGRGGLR